MDASDLTRAKRDRVLYNAKGATSQQPSNKTLQTDSQTLINIARGPRQTVVNNVTVLPACSCAQSDKGGGGGGGGGGESYFISLESGCDLGCFGITNNVPAGTNSITVIGGPASGILTITIGLNVTIANIVASAFAIIPITPLLSPTTIAWSFTPDT